MKILLTGASGFIGKYVASELLRRHHKVCCLIRRPDSLSIQGADTIIADLKDLDALAETLKKKEFETVIDSAAKIPLATDKDEDYFDNILFTRNLLNSLRAAPPVYFLKLSTIDVYKIKHTITESTEVSPQNSYSLSKRVSEQLVEIWSKELNVSSCILRLTQIFGAGDRSNKFIPSVIKQIKGTSRIILYGDGHDRRDYLFVEDAARLIAESCEKKIIGTFNMASGESHSLNEVVKSLQTITGKEFQLEYRDRKKPRLDYQFDIHNLLNALGQLQLTSLSEALKRTYYQET
jgi:nucleoside-diphosphate-sugar epimerase